LANRSYQAYNYKASGTAPGTVLNAAVFGIPRTYGIAVQYKYH